MISDLLYWQEVRLYWPAISKALLQAGQMG